MTCSIENCEGPVEKRGMCSKHYQRLRIHGDPHFTAKTPNGEAQRYFEDVVCSYTGTDCLDWPYSRNAQGYATIGKGLATRPICSRVNGPPPSPKHEAAHTCGRGADGCVAPKHLVWKTRKENEQDKVAHGTHNRGQRSAHAKLSDDQARAVKALIGSASLADIARRFGVSATTIWEIKVGKRWAWLNREAA